MMQFGVFLSLTADQSWLHNQSSADLTQDVTLGLYESNGYPVAIVNKTSGETNVTLLTKVQVFCILFLLLSFFSFLFFFFFYIITFLSFFFLTFVMFWMLMLIPCCWYRRNARRASLLAVIVCLVLFVSRFPFLDCIDFSFPSWLQFFDAKDEFLCHICFHCSPRYVRYTFREFEIIWLLNSWILFSCFCSYAARICGAWYGRCRWDCRRMDTTAFERLEHYRYDTR
jgi:hypothetical protein